MFIVAHMKMHNDVKSCSISGTSLQLFSSRQEAENEAKKLTGKHKKCYYVLNILSETNFKNVVTAKKL